MKKTYLAKRNALLSSGSLSGGLFVLACVGLVLLVRLIAPNFFWRTVTPLFWWSDAIAAENHALWSGFGNAVALTQLNEKLASDNAALTNENEALTQKVANLSALLSSSSQRNTPGILAEVVARPPESPYDTLVLAAGKKEGVILGMEAFGQGGVPIGVVSSVLDDFSRVTLFSAPGVTTNGWVGHANVPLVIVGAGGGALQAGVARPANIVVGDTVFAPGPGMLPIGSVVRVDSDPLSPSETLRIQPAANFFSIAEVELRATGVVPSLFATSTTL